MRGDLNLWWRVGLALVAPIVRLLFRVRVAGVHHVPLAGPAILAFNHVSVLDGPVVAIETGWRRRRSTRFLVAAEIFRRPVTGWILRRFRQIPLVRGRRDAAALDEAIATVARGAVAGIAPEGRVNAAPGPLQRIRSGVARIALPTGAPVIPVGIWGTHRRWPKGARSWALPLRPRLGLAYGAPFAADGDLAGADDVEAFLERLRVALEAQVAEARRLALDPG